MNHVGSKKIETDRLILRKFVLSDAKAIYENYDSDSEVSKYLTWSNHKNVEESEEIIKQWLKSYCDNKFYLWAIVLKEFGDFPIGSISVVSMNEDISMVQIGYCIGKKYWNKGITKEALKAVINFLFSEVNVNRIEARHDTNNIYSGRVMLSCGMKYEGTMRSADKNNQGICDVSYYSILKSEWEL